MRRGGSTRGDANRAFYRAPRRLVVALVAPCVHTGTPAGAYRSPMAFGRFVLASLASSTRLLAGPDLTARYLLRDEEHGGVSILESHQMNH